LVFTCAVRLSGDMMGKFGPKVNFIKEVSFTLRYPSPNRWWFNFISPCTDFSFS